MRIVQMLPTLAFGDAIGNDTLALDQALRDGGYDASIYAGSIDARLKASGIYEADEYEPRKDDLLIYHLSTGVDLNYKISEYDCRKVIMYHNVTPPEFFSLYDRQMAEVCAKGLRAAGYLKKHAAYCFADSEFNRQQLLDMGYTCSIQVLPILIAFDDYRKKPDAAVLQKYNDDYVNIVFTGRIVPNKKHENIIAAFCYYKKYINPKSRLILVGRQDYFPEYFARLQRYVDQLEVEDVIFTGQVKFDAILAYYQVADVFVCLSEHEGFCVPLVEAMVFDVPVIAYDSCAVGETLGGSGLLLSENSPAVVAEAIHRVVSDRELREKMIAGQRKRLKYFEHASIKKQFLDGIAGLIRE